MKILIVDTYPMKASSWLLQLINDLGSKSYISLDYVNINNNLRKDWKDKLSLSQKKIIKIFL